MTWAKLALAIAQLLNLLASLFKSEREREAGRAQANLENKEATDAVTQEAVDARREQRIRNDADPDGLRAPDKHSRT